MVQKGVSLNPDEMAEGGGLADDLEMEITKARFVVWDYDGKSPVEVIAVDLDFVDNEGDVINQKYSAGSAADFQPSEDGKIAVPTGTKKAIVKNTNVGFLMAALFSAGYPKDKLSDDISVLEGLHAHWNRLPVPKRDGLAPRTDGRVQTVLVPTKILRLPGEKAAAKTSGGGGGAADDDLEAEGQAFLIELLAEKGAVEKKTLTAQVFKRLSSKPAATRNKISKLVLSEDFQARAVEAGMCTVDGDTINPA